MEVQGVATVVGGMASIQTKRAKGRIHSPRLLQRQVSLGRKIKGGITAKPKREQKASLRPKDTEISC